MLKEISNEIESILAQEKCKESDCVSLYEVYSVISQRCNDYNNLRALYGRKIGSKMEGFGDVWNVASAYHIEKFDFENMEMTIEFDYGRTNDSATFTKIGNDLFMSSRRNIIGNKLLNKCSEKISECYDNCLKYKEIFTQKSKNIESVNSNYKINISGEKISISREENINGKIDMFELSINTLRNESHYWYDKTEFERCNPIPLISEFTNRDVEILKSIFIRIEDCPEWTKNIIYEIREKQLEKESKQQKRLNFTKKLFPLLKK